MHDRIEGLLNKIIQGDYLEIMKDIPDDSIDMILTDPPYGVSEKGVFETPEKNYKRVYEEWDIDVEELTKKFIKESYRVLKNGGAIYITCSFHNLRLCWDALEKEGFTFRNNFVFAKTNAMPIKFAKQIGIYAYSYENALYFTKGVTKTFNYNYLKAINGGKQFRDFMVITNRDRSSRFGKHLHPCEKPLPVFELFIHASSNKDDIILDPFIGSGTTAVACKKLNRKFIGIEINPEYCKIAKKRLVNIPSGLETFTLFNKKEGR